MKDEEKTKVQLLAELAEARRQVAELTALNAHHEQAAEDWKRAETALRTSEERIQVGLEGTNIGLWDWNVPTGEVVFVRHWAEILGYDPSEAIPHISMWEEHLHPDDKPWVLQALNDHLEGKTDLYETVHRLRAPSGQWRWVLDRGRVVLRDGEGKPLRAVGMHMDVTDQKCAQEAVEREQRRLRQTLDLHERERQLTAYEIHDGFTQKATGAKLHLEAFRQMCHQNAPTTWDAFQAGLDLLGQSIDDSRAMLNGLRPPALDDFGLLDALEQLVADIGRRERPDIAFRHSVEFHRLSRPLESGIYRIAEEALTNACRYSRSDRIELRLLQTGNQLRVEVEDWGIGFHPDEIRPGHFGLEGIRQRALVFNGRATVHSAPGQGTRVLVELPILEG